MNCILFGQNSEKVHRIVRLLELKCENVSKNDDEMSLLHGEGEMSPHDALQTLTDSDISYVAVGDKLPLHMNRMVLEGFDFSQNGQKFLDQLVDQMKIPANANAVLIIFNILKQ